MDTLLAARTQMAVSFIFHIVFACIGIAMPWLMFIAEWKWIKTGNKVYKELAKAWSRGVAIFFAVGAVSGTVLSFELGLLWPNFMKHAGAIIGMPFSWEGTAFFLEGIALGLFLYGWKTLNKYVHLFAGMVVGLAGVVSGIFVIAANGWMNSPSGFDWVNGQAINIDPFKAMFNKAWFEQALHMTIAAFVATCFAVAGVHAILLLKTKNHPVHMKAVSIAMSVGAIAAILQPLSGDISARTVGKLQPAKLAAMEAVFETKARTPLVIGGLPDTEKQKLNYAIEIPGMLSYMVHGDPDKEVAGLDQTPRKDWPPVILVHLSFQLMVLLGMLMALSGVLFLIFSIWKREKLTRRWWLKTLAWLTPAGFIAVEAGWMVTELGRQPWTIYGILRTSESVTPMPGIQVSFVLITLIYLFLSFVCVWLLQRQIKALHSNINLDTYD